MKLWWMVGSTQVILVDVADMGGFTYIFVCNPSIDDECVIAVDDIFLIAHSNILCVVYPSHLL